MTHSKWSTLRTFLQGVFGRNNLIGTDFIGIRAWHIDDDKRITTKFVQSTGGAVLVQFAISTHALGKLSRGTQERARELITATGNDYTPNQRDDEVMLAFIAHMVELQGPQRKHRKGSVHENLSGALDRIHSTAIAALAAAYKGSKKNHE